ncbi:HAD family hydrolase [Candidatus Woesearchaeota archaeon]|nr:HAD family hydrolase [Candidatus Woesearchaeota archaeon]
MIKAVIFDFWGTLVENGTYSPLRQTYEMFRIRVPFGNFVTSFEQLVMTKSYKDKTEAFTKALELFQRTPRDNQMDLLIGIWNKNVLLAKLYPETIEVLEELKKKKIKLAVVSNMPSFAGKEILEKFGLEKYFNVIMLSYEEGILKNSPEFFNKTLEKLKVKKEEALMVGDSVPTDIKGAEAAGIKAVLVDRADTREFENKIIDLKQVEEYLE